MRGTLTPPLDGKGGKVSLLAYLDGRNVQLLSNQSLKQSDHLLWKKLYVLCE